MSSSKSKVMKFTVYRGETEEVTEQKNARLVLHKNHIELHLEYAFREWNESTQTLTDEYVALRSISHKNAVIIQLAMVEHTVKGEKEVSPAMIMSTGKDETWLRGHGPELETMWLAIRDWMINGEEA